MAVLGELGVEGVEDLVVVEGDHPALELRPTLGGEVVEAAQVERSLLADLGAVADASNNHPVVVPAVGEGGEVHGVL